MPDAPHIVWFRNDLRLDDQPAFSAAAASGQPVVALYVLDDRLDCRPLGAATRWWLHESLTALQRDLTALGVPLILRRGPAARTVATLARDMGAAAVHWTRGTTPTLRALDRATEDALNGLGQIARSDLLADPAALRNGQGQPYKVFTAFWKVLQAGFQPVPPLPAPTGIIGAAAPVASDRLADWALQPTAPDWAAGFRETWTPGEGGAFDRLDAFVNGPVHDYTAHRDRPAIKGTSRLSPHLVFGELSPRRIWHVVRSLTETAGEPFLRQLGWREFNHHLLFHAPDLHDTPLRPEFAAFPWQDDPAAFAAWCEGRTGFPIVDAGMRQLWHTGWMHNRVRMICASFLVKDLLLPWQWGERWFHDTLVDACPANNPGNWQWVAGCGADAAPYFRVFNPTLQGAKFDPDGAYLKAWVPEAASPTDLFSPGKRYPRPMVDHASARQRALAAYATIRKPGV